jgi:hypothetical protein
VEVAHLFIDPMDVPGRAAAPRRLARLLEERQRFVVGENAFGVPRRAAAHSRAI